MDEEPKRDTLPDAILDHERYADAEAKVEKILAVSQLMGCVAVAWIVLIGFALGALGFAGSIETIMFVAAMAPIVLVTIWCWRNEVVPLRRKGSLVVGPDARRIAVRMLLAQAGIVSFVWFGPLAFRQVFKILSLSTW